MTIRALLLALACCCACSYEPFGSCAVDSQCSPGTTCQGRVCVSCPSGICVASKVVPPAGDTVVVYPAPYSSLSSVTVTFPAAALAASTAVTLTNVSCSSIVPPAGSVCIAAFDLAATGVTRFAHPLRVTGSNITAANPSTLLMVARQENGSWIDTITAITGGLGSFKTLHASGSLTGILQPGRYLVFQPAPGSPEALMVADFGIALVPDDGNGSAGLQIVSLYDDDGNPLAKPTLSALPVNGADLDGAGLTPDGSQGVMVDGTNFVVFFSGVGSGAPVASPKTIDVTNYGGDGDAIAIMPDGDEAIVSADIQPTLVVITGIASGQPALATTIPLPAAEDGLAISSDGKALLGRGAGILSVFSIAPVPRGPGPLGGTVSHSYTHVADFTTQLSSPSGEDGRDGMAFDPGNSSHAVVVGKFPGAVIQLLTGLPGNPVVHAPVAITGAVTPYAVAITRDGTRAIVGTDAGLVLFTLDYNAGTLQQVGTPFSPAFTNTQTFTLSKAGVPTLGITLDGAFVVALTGAPDPTNGTLLLIPLAGNGFGAPVGQLNGVAVPYNDQILMH